MFNAMKMFLELSAKAESLKEGLRQGQSAVSGFAQHARSEAQAIRGVYDSLMGRLAAMGLSAGAGYKLWQSAQLDKSLTQIGQTAGATANKVVSLRSDLFGMAKDSGQEVDNLKEGFNVLIQTGLNMKEAKATLEGLNVAMAVTGAESRVLANGLTVAATAFQFDLAKPGQALELLDKMTVAGRLGNAELQNLSDIFARVGVNAKSAGMSFDKTLGFIEALSMVERQPERLATLADSTLRLFTNLRYMADAMKATRVQFFDAKGTRRDALNVLKDIKEKYDALKTDKERAIFMQRAFGKADLDTIKGLRTLFQGDALQNIDQFSGKTASAGGTLKRDMNDATKNLVDQVGRLKASLREAADDFAKPINKTLAELIEWIMAKKTKGGLELSGKEIMGYGTVGVLGTWALSRYGAKGIEWLRKGRGAKMAGTLADIQKVYVVNMPGGDIYNKLPGGPLGGNTPVPGSGPGSTAGKLLPWLAAAAANPVTAAIAGFGALAYMTVKHPEIADMAEANVYGRDEYREETLRQAFSGIKSPDVKNDIQMQIRIDKEDRVWAETGDTFTRIGINLERGAF